MNQKDIYSLLESRVEKYNRPDFITHDPITIPHQFTRKEDVEIMGFWSAMLAWGQRVTIINKCNDLIRMMDGAPYEFIMNHQDSDLKPFVEFKHRTFNGTDALYFIETFRRMYSDGDSMSEWFRPIDGELTMEGGLNRFRGRFFDSPNAPHRTGKHVSSPLKKSSCKRLNMFLRWMVRKDENGVDFGLWNDFGAEKLICPLDVHVDRVARKLGLIQRKQVDWLTAIELTEQLRMMDAGDPVKYDFALFGLGIEEKF
ncbi:MAG: hypothetical protein ACJATA_000186 [Sphingobacteriales bacterium]